MNTDATTGKFEYLNKESLDENFKCPICANPLFNPVSTNCNPESHMFCRDCIEKLIKSNPSCPTCNQKLYIQDLTRINLANISNLLNDLLVKCIACKQTGLKRIDSDAHYNEICPKVEFQCPSSDNKCSWKGTRSQLEEHLKICSINIIKSLLIAFQTNSQQSEDKNFQLQAKNEQLRSDKKPPQDRVNKQRLPPVPSIKASQQRQVVEPVKINTQINSDKIFEQFSPIFDKLDQHRIQTEGIIKQNKQLSAALNQATMQNTAPKDMNKELGSQPKQPVTIEPGKIQESLIDGYTNQKYGNSPGGHTEKYAYHPVPKTIPNIPVDTSGYGQPFPQNYFNANSYANVNNNPSSATAQNALNHPGMEPFIIPISISISVNTNIVDANTGINGGRTNNNVVGCNSISICAGNITIGGGRHNNVAGGSNNKIAGGNNYGCGGSNNNDTADRNNNLLNGTNNPGGIINDISSNNRAGNNITGNENNIAGGNDNNIVSGIINIGGSSNTIAGGYDNYIAGGNNSTYDNNNRNEHNDTPNDDGSEDGTNNSVDHPNDEGRSEISSIGGRLRANPYDVHPPDVINRWNY